MSPDPSGLAYADQTNPQSFNLYSYVLNNPLTNIDPDGLDCVYFNNSGDAAESIDHNSNSDECGQHGGDWVNGTTSNSQIKYNAGSDNFNITSSDGDNTYHTGVVAPGSVDGGVPCYGNCTQSYYSSSNIQTISSSIQQQFIPALAQTSVNFNRAIPVPCGIGGNAGLNVGRFRFGVDLSTNKGTRFLSAARVARSDFGSAGVTGKDLSFSASVSQRIPDTPFSVTASAKPGGITSLGVGIVAPSNKGQVGVYVPTGNMQDGCHGQR
jgi:hypothetical protein